MSIHASNNPSECSSTSVDGTPFSQYINEQIESQTSQDYTQKGGYNGTTQDLKDEFDNAIFNGAKTYQTLADFNAVSPVPEDGTPFIIANDSNEENNGQWSVQGGVAVQNARTVENVVERTNDTKGVTGLAVDSFIKNEFDVNLSNKLERLLEFDFGVDWITEDENSLTIDSADATRSINYYISNKDNYIKPNDKTNVKLDINVVGGSYLIGFYSRLNGANLETKVFSGSGDFNSTLEHLFNNQPQITDFRILIRALGGAILTASNLYVGKGDNSVNVKKYNEVYSGNAIDGYVYNYSPVYNLRNYRNDSLATSLTNYNLGEIKGTDAGVSKFDFNVNNTDLINSDAFYISALFKQEVLSAFKITIAQFDVDDVQINTRTLGIYTQNIFKEFYYTNSIDANASYIRITLENESGDANSSVFFQNFIISNKPVNQKSIIKDTFPVKYETALEIFKDNVRQAIVGGKVWEKKKQEKVKDYMDEASNQNVYDTLSTKSIQDRVYNPVIVDTKGTDNTGFKGRVLLHIDNDGWMYFKNANTNIERIKCSDFENLLVQHDGSGIDVNNLQEVLTLDPTQTNTEKQAWIDANYQDWKMVPASADSLFEQVANTGIYNTILVEFPNRSLLCKNRLIRKDWTVVTPILNFPIIGNPVEVYIKDGATELFRDYVENLDSILKFGILNETEKAAINFNHNKSISFSGQTLSSGNYTIGLRMRRCGTDVVSGNINVFINDVLQGTIPVNTPIDTSGGDSYENTVDVEALINLSSSLGVSDELKLTVSCDTTKDLEIGNGGALNLWNHTNRDRFAVLGEYSSAGGGRTSGLVYFSQDNGENWNVIFDMSLNPFIDGNTGTHIHAAFIDPFWKQIHLLFGDEEEYNVRINITDTLSQNNVKYQIEKTYDEFYSGKEQWVSGYAMSDVILFGSDAIPTCFGRMNRVDKEKLTSREMSFLISDTLLTHVPTHYSRQNETDNLLIRSSRANVNHPVREQNTSLLHCTSDGIHFKEIWKDVIKHKGFGQGNNSVVFHYNNKIYSVMWGDGRFENDHFLLIGDYKV